MTCRPSRTDQIGGDERLAMPGFKRMEPAQRRRNECSGYEKQRIASLRRDQFGEGTSWCGLPVSGQVRVRAPSAPPSVMSQPVWLFPKAPVAAALTVKSATKACGGLCSRSVG